RGNGKEVEVDVHLQLAREIRHHHDGVETGVQRTTQGTVTPYPGFTATVLSALKFVAEDVLVLRVRLESTLPTARTYDAAALAARVGREIFPVALTDASGAIPANGSAEIYVVIAETADGGRANLTGQETFNVLVSRP
ncbi:MAG: hypothetical protein JWM32_3151, partial [Verrucomicrobia bacterium]|nr:hypothetical protein [Verrucomicrobiota bacterium]